MLQRNGRQRDESIRMRGHPLRQPLVLGADDGPRQVTVGGIPPVPVDRQRLDVDALLVHHRRSGPGQGGCFRHHRPCWKAASL